MKTLTKIILAIFLVSCTSTNTSNKQKIIKELNQCIIELPKQSPLLYTDQLIEGLFDWSNYSVIGLGESAHGAKEFFELKHRIFKYLVENQNFKVLAYEFSFRTSLKINDYVMNGKGTLDSLFAGELWIQDNYQVQDLIKWMHSYNLGKDEIEKVKFVGIDNQLDAFNPERTIDCINKYFPEILSLNSSLVQEILNLDHIRYRKITTEEYKRREEIYLRLISAANSYFKLNNENETLDQKITIRLIESLLRSNEWLYNIYTGKSNNRDKDLTENLLWVKDCNNSKVAIWAHTSHVQNNPNFYGDQLGSMGYYLRDSLKENYLIVSTAFTKGKFKAVMEGSDGDTPPLDCEIIENPLPESINEIFYQAKHKDFFLDVSKIQQSSNLYSYLDTVRPMLGVGDCYAGSIKPHYQSPERQINLLTATNIVFYFSDTHPVRVHERFNTK